jgi:flagellar basal-body rod modification protein FlgD
MAKQLDTPQLFIKLLMAELQHENPTSPTTPSSILQQTAELSQVEVMNSLTTALTAEQRYAQEADATGLIGKQVTALVTGKAISGTVSKVSLAQNGTPTVDIGTTSVPLSSLTSVSVVTSTTSAA